MSITPPTGILDITDAIVRVSKLEFRGATGFDTILNNVARNTVLLVDQNVEYTSSNSWALKLPNAWVAEFDAYWASGASGNIDFNVYNDATSGTNGYTISMDDTTITVAYDGGSALETVTLGSTLKNDTWRKIHVLFERDMISVALDGVPVLYFKDTLLRPRVYDENSGYVVASGLSADRKFKNLRVVNGDKWITDGTSNIAYVHGNVGIGTKTPEYTLDVKGDVRATGNLLIEGLTTTVDTQNLSIEDAIVEIGRGNDGGTSGKDVGFLFTRNDGTNTTNSNVALIYDESTDRLTFGYSDGSPTDSTLAINTSKSLDVVIPSGNVGIGTASPNTLLELSKATGSATISPTELRLTTTTDAADWDTTNSWARLAFYTNDVTGDAPGVMASVGAVASSVDGGENTRLAFFTAEPHLERMCVDRYGNVGIGTTSPGQKLEVGHYGGALSSDFGAIRITNFATNLHPSSLARFDISLGDIDGGTGSGKRKLIFNSKTTTTDSGTDILCLDGESNNVGIGTVSPLQTLHVAGNGQNPVIYMADSTNTRYASGMGTHHVSNEGQRLDFYTGDSGANGTSLGSSHIRMSIKQNGNVGIGTASPGEKLHVLDANSYSVAGRIQSKSSTSAGTSTSAYMDVIDGTGHGGYIQGYHDAYVTHGLNLGTWSSNARDSAKMIIRSNGTVGIGTATPYSVLHVQGNFNENISHAVRTYFNSYQTALIQNTHGWGGTCIVGQGNVLSTGYFVSHRGTLGASDTRIKKNIVDADDAECLETLRLLKPKKYQYRDDIGRGQEPVWGFIAQEVRETLPYATQLTQDVLPNIYELANVSQSNVITFTNFNTSNLESNATTLIRTKGIDGKDHDIHLAEVIDEHTIRVEEDLSEWTGSVDAEGNVVAGNQLFIYGQEVDDFVFLKKDAIWTVATSALQEVDRQLQAEKAKVATLETQLTSVLARLDALESA